MRNYSRIALLQKKRLQAHIRKLHKSGLSYFASPSTPLDAPQPAMSGPDVNQTSAVTTQGASSSSSIPTEAASRTQSLANILDGDARNAALTEEPEEDDDAMDDEEPDTVAKEGYCVECEGTSSTMPV